MTPTRPFIPLFQRPSFLYVCSLFLLFFSLVASASRGGPGWLIGSVVVWLAWAIALSKTNPLFPLAGTNVGILPLQPAWQTAVNYVYIVFIVAMMVGALVEVERRLAHTARERWVFRFIILAHAGMYLSATAFGYVELNHGIDSAELLVSMIDLVCYCITPLMIVQ